MKNTKLTFLSVLFALLGNCFLAMADPDPNFHIYLCFGQSNMEGAAQPESQDRTCDSRFQMMSTANCGQRQLGKWYTATPPLAHCSSGLGPTDYFGRTLVQNLNSNIKVGVVVVAVGGADIKLFEEDKAESYVAGEATWFKNLAAYYNNNGYKRLLECAKMAQKDGVIKGILLHQGETNNMQQDWPNRVKAIYDKLLSQLGLNAADVPLLVGETRQDGACNGHNGVIAKMPSVIKNSYVISSKNLEGMGNGDRFHFTAAGYREFGKRYAEQMLKLLPASDKDGSGSNTNTNNNNNNNTTNNDLENQPVSGAKGGTNYYVNGRQVYVYAPQNIRSHRPLLISMHGMNQDINYQKNQAKWESVADTANFVVAYPSGENKSWDISGDKDTKYLIAIIDKMSQDYKIDKSRVYLSGFSMGGMMTYHAMNKIPDYFAAFAPVSGYQFGNPCNASTRAVPLIHTHGTADDVVHFQPSGGQSGAEAVIDKWQKHNNCKTKKVTTVNGATRTTYSGGDCDADVVLNAIPNKGHWHSNDAYNTTREIWLFVRRYTTECNSKPIVIVPQTPFNGTPAPIPGKIEAEEYDYGGQDVAYNDNDSENRNGGKRNEGVDMNDEAIGYTEKGEWIKYTVNVEKTDSYTMEARVASGSDGSSFQLYMDDKAISEEISVPNTGDWSTFEMVSAKVGQLTEGKHELKLVITGSWVDMDYMLFKSANTTDIEVITEEVILDSSYDIYDLLGRKVGAISAEEISSLGKGAYLLKGNQSGKVKKVIITQ